MKRFLLTIFIVSALAVNAQCKKAKNGIFISDDEITGRTIIQRFGNVQLSENKTTGTKSLEKLEWINDCTYKIFDIKLLENKINISPPSGSIIVTLERINDSTYNQKVYIEQIDFEHISKITKINNDFSEEFNSMIKK